MADRRLVLWTPNTGHHLDEVLGPVLDGVRDVQVDVVKAPRNPGLGAGTVVLGMGTPCLRALQERGVLPKNRSIKGLRLAPIMPRPAEPSGLFLTYAPGSYEDDIYFLEDMRWDCRLALRYLRTGTVHPRLGYYRWVTDLSPLIRRVRALHKKLGHPVPVTHDLETGNGNDAWDPACWILSTFYTIKPGYAVGVHFPTPEYLPTGRLLRQITWLATSPLVATAGSGYSFDMHMMREKWGVRVTNYVMDLVLASSMVNENRPNSLNANVKVYVPELGGYDDPFNQTYDKAHMESVPTTAALEHPITTRSGSVQKRDPLLCYAGADTDGGHRTRAPIRKDLIRDRQAARLYQRITHPGQVTFNRVEERGIAISREGFEVLRDELKGEIDETYRGMVEILPARIRNKYADDLSFSRPTLLRDLFFSRAGFGLKPSLPEFATDKTRSKEPTEQVPQTSEVHLRQFHEHEEAGPFLEFLLRYRSAEKTLSTFVDGFLQHLRADGRFHPEYFLFKGRGFDEDKVGTVTGRTSAKRPAVQTVPKHTKWAKKILRCFVAPDGHVVLAPDYSQGELRITACIAPEPNMIEAYQRGDDLHAKTAAEVNKVDFAEFMAMKKCGVPEKEAWFAAKRQGGKAGNFGLIYAMSAMGFVDYAWKAYQVLMTLPEAEAFRDTFLNELYPGLPAWHERQQVEARDRGVVRSLLGRPRHLPLIHSRNPSVRGKERRRAINSPVQGTLTDMTVWAMNSLEEELGDGGSRDFLMVGMTHDQVFGYAPADRGREVAGRVKEIMESLPFEDFDWRPEVPFPVDVVMGPNLGDVEELKL